MPSGFEPLKAFGDFRLSLVSLVNGVRFVKEAGLVPYLRASPTWMIINSHIRIVNWRARNVMKALGSRHQLPHTTSKPGSHPAKLQSNTCHGQEMSSHQDQNGLKACCRHHDNLPLCLGLTSHTPHPSLSSKIVLILPPPPLFILTLHAPLRRTTAIAFVLCLLSHLLRPTSHFRPLASSNHRSPNHHRLRRT